MAMDRQTVMKLHLGLQTLEAKRTENFHREAANRISTKSLEAQQNAQAARQAQHEAKVQELKVTRTRVAAAQERKRVLSRQQQIRSSIRAHIMRVFWYQGCFAAFMSTLLGFQWSLDLLYAWQQEVRSFCPEPIMGISLSFPCQAVFYSGLLLAGSIASVVVITVLAKLPAIVVTLLVTAVGLTAIVSSGLVLELPLIVGFALAQACCYSIIAYVRTTKADLPVTVREREANRERTQQEAHMRQMDFLCDVATIILDLSCVLLLVVLVVYLYAPTGQKGSCLRVWEWATFALQKNRFAKLTASKHISRCVPVKRLWSILKG
jgi:hypothetical protein